MTHEQTLQWLKNNKGWIDPYEIPDDVIDSCIEALEELEAIKSADGSEAMEALRELSIQTDKEIVYQDEINGLVNTLNNFILKAQAQEKKIEKKDKLLELYRECNKEGYFWLEIQQRIRALEEEMK